MDYIHIDNLFCKGKHGVYDHERHVEQEFEVSLKLAIDTTKAGKSDHLADTVDYQKTKDTVVDTIAGKSRYLIEALAEDITAKILQDNRVQSIEITIKKTAVWDNGTPGVTIIRRNK